MSDLNKGQRVAVIACLLLFLALLGIWLATTLDQTTALIGLTGLFLLAVALGYWAIAEKYSRSSLRVAVGLAAGWMVLPAVLFGAVVLVSGSPGPMLGGGSTTSNVTTVFYRNGQEVGRSTERATSSGDTMALTALGLGIVWTGYAGLIVYRGFRGRRLDPPE